MSIAAKIGALVAIWSLASCLGAIAVSMATVGRPRWRKIDAVCEKVAFVGLVALVADMLLAATWGVLTS